MKKTRKISKKGWAGIVAAALVVAIVLTGTLAWRNMTQKSTNELLKQKNPGGRMHDDFNGEENKDIYAENFTDKESGAPVYVRVRLLEYMETGEEAGLNRTVLDEDGKPVLNPDRKAKPLMEGAKITDTSTWHIHKHGAEDDPFHDYWRWEMGGETVYMPTFNKNKDSLSVDVNGTYVGKDKDFRSGEPFDDYKTYTAGKESDELPAYYDADDNDFDEYVEGTSPAPGAGGVKKDPDATDQNPKPNYEEKKEKHIAQSTLKGLGVISMEEWKAAEMPICNRWVYDADGWFYWPEPVQPQSATGLLLSKVTQADGATDSCYYAIELQGQFIDNLTESGLGTPVEYEKNEDGSNKVDDETGEPVVKNPATGFYVYGISDDAVDLLKNATKVKVDKAGKWYFPENEHHIFREITDDEGTLGTHLIWWGEDGLLGTDDDRADVIYIPEGVTSVEGNSHGNYFLPPRLGLEGYYSTTGPDNEFGTDDDSRLWILGDTEFPEGAMDTVVDAISVKAPEGMTEFTESETTMIEMEVGTTLANAFTAQVKLGEEDADNTAVTWSVAGVDGKKLAEHTAITPSGVLTVDENEKPRLLAVTATSKLDNRQKARYTVKVYGKVNVQITLPDGAEATQIQAGKSLELKATLCRAGEIATEQPASFTWSAAVVPAGRAVNTGAVDITDGVLTVGRGVTGAVTVTAQCDVGGVTKSGSFSLTVTSPEAITLALSGGGASIEPGDTTGVTYVATLSGPTGELADTGIDWQVGKSGNSGQSITAISGVTITNGKLVLPANYSFTNNGTTLWVKATAKDPTANASAATSIAVLPPNNITALARKDGKELKIKADGVAVPLTAKVMRDAAQYKGSQEVTWWVGNAAGGAIDGVTISTDGQVTVAAGVTATEFVVKATSKVKTDLVKQFTVPVDDGKLRIGDVEFLVLYEDAAKGRQLVITKDCVTIMAHSDSDARDFRWENSNVKAWMNDTWLDSVDGLRARVWKDPSTNNYATYYCKYTDTAGSFNDAVFLLSRADVMSNSTDPQDYTTGLPTVSLIPGGSTQLTAWKAAYDGDYTNWSLRTGNADQKYYYYFENGRNGTTLGTATSRCGIRPALWLKTSAS